MGELQKRIKNFEKNLVEKNVVNEKEASTIADVFLNLGEEMRQDFRDAFEITGIVESYEKLLEVFEKWMQ